jgi:hypothetical protein
MPRPMLDVQRKIRELFASQPDGRNCLYNDNYALIDYANRRSTIKGYMIDPLLYQP